ncbi:MAG: hypothetical protein K2I07_15170 [Lachnospiraceae bacterium]|nr:hypothetical protein [Lachnospiraceae bacterium]
MKRAYRNWFKIAAAVLFVCFLPGMPVDAQTKVMPDGGVFDPAFYAAAYPDVVAVLGSNEAALYQHYVTCGRAEGRQGCADFDPVFYAAAYPDVVAAYGYNEAALYQHYITVGKREGRLGVTPGSAASKPEAAGVTATSVVRRDRMQVYLNYPGEAAAAVETAADCYVTRIEFYADFDVSNEIWDEAVRLVEAELRDYERCLISGAKLTRRSRNRWDLTFDRLSTIAEEEAVDSMVAQLLPLFNKGTDYEKIRAVHDYLCRTISYSFDTVYNEADERSGYDGLYHYTTVCTGYALLFQKFMDEMGIPCYIGTGSNHAWNIVLLDDQWYHVDCTNDRQNGKVVYNYFLIGSDNTGYTEWSYIPLASTGYAY